ncbi:hypothetical protein NPJ88_012750 [Halomonas elongata]|uniref:hypothetical protein n=1 Tax=Halomonas elongata TaxID=2746 RepID=UPI00255AD577|nr:hypothetical protein [Halomonas elongata]MDL4863207.1 hypothetical protein [Halomonas elongata]
MADAQDDLKRDRGWKNSYISHMERTRIKEIARQSAVGYKLASGEGSTGSEFMDSVKETANSLGGLKFQAQRY